MFDILNTTHKTQLRHSQKTVMPCLRFNLETNIKETANQDEFPSTRVNKLGICDELLHQKPVGM